MAKLVIVESPAKARSIGRYLGRGYTVKATLGHVRDLPKTRMGIDIEGGFLPTYRVLPDRRKTIEALKKAAKAAEEVYLATDPDREGESIAWHVAEAVGLDSNKAKRVTFNEITPGAIREAFRRPGPIDLHKVNAQQARRLLDRIVGYELSPLLWRKVTRGLSAGRVQSVAVLLIVEREREIEAFTPREYWEIEAELRGPDGETFRAKLERVEGHEADLPDEEAARSLLRRLEGERFVVARVERREKKGRPSPPFITSRLQQAAWSQLRFSTRQTMRIAQQLYEGVDLGEEGPVGLITYMRTDSVHVSPKAVAECREFIAGTLGEEFLSEKPRQFQDAARAQGAHEAIRPTEVRRRPEDVKAFLDERQFRLYDLIWRQFVASQMADSRRHVVTATIACGPAEFTATGSVVVFPGFETVAGPREQETRLPPLREGEDLVCTALEPQQRFTQPPPRYTEASLVRTLERLGIGRPSTYAPIISTIQERGYVLQRQRRLYPTPLGRLVTEELRRHFPDLVNVEFTSRMEDDLDRVENGEEDWRRVLSAFYDPFKKDLEKAMSAMERVPGRTTEEKCEKCGANLVIRSGKYGLFLGCPNYPECTYTRPLEERPPAQPTDETCPECGKPLALRAGRRGPFYGCTGYPDCRYTRPAQANAPARAAPEKTDIACEKCGQPMVIRSGVRGRFLGCSAFPKCRYTRPLPGGEENPPSAPRRAPRRRRAPGEDHA